jgi:argininosuccinate synthase
MAARNKAEKVVLAYSGGLDTSVILPWLKETYGYEVVAFAAELGQGDELTGIQKKALATGAVKCIVKISAGNLLKITSGQCSKAARCMKTGTCWERALPGR